MNRIERMAAIDAFYEGTIKTNLIKKGDEYNVNGDVNGNFKRLAAKQGVPVAQVWNTHFQKHMDSIDNFIKTGRVSCDEPIEGRIGDAVSYLLILKTLIEEGVVGELKLGEATDGQGPNLSGD